LYEKADGATYGKLKEFASENRKNPTQAESILWNLLKGKQLGVSFRRQHVIDQFIADFVCLSHHLVIEIDGGYHQLPEQQISDQERTQRLKELGMKVIRFTNEEIIGNTDMVINQIKNVLK
jgi:very-short-patch-repair endonuclease